MRNRFMALLMACLFFVQSSTIWVAKAHAEDRSSSSANPPVTTAEVLRILDQPALVQSTGEANGVMMQTQAIENVDAASVGEVVNYLSEKSGKEVLVVTDSNAVFDDVTADYESAKEKGSVKKPNFISLNGKLKKTKELLQKNKVGLIITLATTTLDSVILVQTVAPKLQLDSAQVGFLLFFNWAINLKFGIDPDSWAETTQKIDHSLLALLEKTGLAKKGSSTVDKTAFFRRYLANFGMYFAINTTRYSIIDFHHLTSSMQTAGFWIPPLIIASAASFTTHGWSEFSMKIKESKHPLAKSVVRYFSYARQMFMGFAAPNSVLIGGNSMGAWATVVVHGLAGLGVYWFKDKTVSTIENKLFNREWYVDKYKNMKTKLFPDRITTPTAANSCTAVF